MPSRKKIALIGAGQIGGVIAQLLAQKALGDIVLFDVVEGLPQGKALDIAEASRLLDFNVNVIGVNDYSDIADAAVIIVTAGFTRQPGMSRNDLLLSNAKIIREVAEQVKRYAPEAINIIVSNPLDAMVTLYQKITGFETNRVMGQAGVLDSSRFATFIAWELNVSVKDVNAMVLGGHGDTMIPLLRYANVNGIPVMDLLIRKYQNEEKANAVMSSIVERVRKAGGEIVALLKKGSAFVSPAAAAVAMTEAVLNNQKRILPVCAYLNGQFDVQGCYVGVPAVIGENGVERIIEVTLTADEKKAFARSVDTVNALVGRLF